MRHGRVGWGVACSSFPSARSPRSAARTGHRAVSPPALAAALRWTYTITGPSLTGWAAVSEAVTVSDNHTAEPALPDLFWAVLRRRIFARRGATVGTDARKAVFNPCSDDNVSAGGEQRPPPLSPRTSSRGRPNDA